MSQHERGAPNSDPCNVKPPICDYFEAGRCRSCTLIETPYDQQLRAKQDRCRALLPSVPSDAWLPAVRGGERDFRNKAKLVVGGGPGSVTLGILGPDGQGVDLRDCLIQSPGIRQAIPRIASVLEHTGLAPYDVPKRRGELKFVHVTQAPSGELMLRFVVRSEEAVDALRRHLGELRRVLPEATVISVNLLPEHKAVLEGEREVLLLGESLGMDLGPVSLHLRTQSFFQTNTAVARELYAQAAVWVDAVDPASLWDLYCGVGGFALYSAQGRAQERARARAGDRDSGAGNGAGAGSRRSRDVLGVELSEAAVRSARRSANEAGLRARFVAADATAYALGSRREEIPDLVIVNPPRRGIGTELAEWLDRGPVRDVVYSSCNPESLARDLAEMPSLMVRQARVFDMFPHTSHLEVAVLLERRR